VLESIRTGKFKQEFALAEKRGKNMDKLIEVMGMLINEQTLPQARYNHPLHGEWEGAYGCHIQGDWVLIYEIDKKTNTITFHRTGTHSDLF
jgi:mRNA interferase YafQ